MFNNLDTLYEWGALAFCGLGIVLAVHGLVTGEVQFIGRSAFADSFIGRITFGIGLGMIGPIVIVIFIISTILSWRRQIDGDRGDPGP